MKTRTGLWLSGKGLAHCLLWALTVAPAVVHGVSPPAEGASAAAMERSRAVGFYDPPDGGQLLVTFAANGPLRVYQLGSDYRSDAIERSGDGGLRWLRSDEGDALDIVFDTGHGARAPGFTASGPAVSLRAERSENPPYELDEVSYANGAVTLSGTVLVPADARAAPGAVLVQGSGDSDRDNGWYLTIADSLARRGIAVLLPDKRGCGRSGGEWRTSSFDDFAGDALAGATALAALPGVEPDQVGLVGISQGGAWVVPAALDEGRALPYAVNLVGAATTPREQLRHETVQTLRQQGYPEWTLGIVQPVASAIPRWRRSEWWSLNGDFDPLPAWRSATMPVLIVYGRDDEGDNVPVAASLARLEPVAAEQPDGRFRIEIFEGSGHGLYAPGTRSIRADFLVLLGDWIVAATGGGTS